MFVGGGGSSIVFSLFQGVIAYMMRVEGKSILCAGYLVLMFIGGRSVVCSH